MIVLHRPTRRGITLLETMVVMTGLAVLLGLCALNIQLLLRVSSDAQARRSTTSALGRLASQYREDVHACDDARLPSPTSLRLIRSPRVVIAYDAREGRVDRVESVNGQATRHESYELGRHAAAAFERRGEGPRQFLALVVRRTPRAGRPDPPRPMEILALTGKDRLGPPRTEGGSAR
jgi:hypothetical protein